MTLSLVALPPHTLDPTFLGSSQEASQGLPGLRFDKIVRHIEAHVRSDKTANDSLALCIPDK